jgi:hypothetical protein
MNAVSLNNIVKYILICITIIVGVVGYTQMINNDLSYLTLFEVYTSKEIFNIYFALNRENFLFLPLFSLILLAPYKVRSALPLLILATLLVLTTSPYFVIFFSYIILTTSNDQIGKKNFFYTGLILGGVLLVAKLFEIDMQLVLPFIFLVLRTFMKRVSQLYDLIILFLCASFFSFQELSSLTFNIFFVATFLLTLLKNGDVEELPLLAYWSLFNKLPIILTISIYALYLIKLNYKYFKFNVSFWQVLNTAKLALFVITIFVTGTKEYTFLFPLLILVTVMSKESRREVLNDF